jgi:hypothetical protein
MQGPHTEVTKTRSHVISPLITLADVQHVEEFDRLIKAEYPLLEGK